MRCQNIMAVTLVIGVTAHAPLASNLVSVRICDRLG
jgi:hypothetical protein